MALAKDKILEGQILKLFKYLKENLKDFNNLLEFTWTGLHFFSTICNSKKKYQ